ncbi:MAG: hypothetical protein E7252_04315 [Lachnospira sp.]|nr:hypothetical protein [Lachnospira sp.]
METRGMLYHLVRMNSLQVILCRDGQEECLADNVGSLIEKGYSAEWIADILEIPISRIEKIVASKRVVMRDFRDDDTLSSSIIEKGQKECLERNISLFLKKGFVPEWIVSTLEISREIVESVMSKEVKDMTEFSLTNSAIQKKREEELKKDIEFLMEKGVDDIEWMASALDVTEGEVLDVIEKMGIDGLDEIL